jgi:VanZ family protein
MFWKHNALGVFWALLILVVCGLPGSQFAADAYVKHVDKIIHVILFGVLVLLFIVGFIKQANFPFLRRNTPSKVFLFATIYGVLIEIMQGTICVGRSIEMGDLFANEFGSILGLGMFFGIYGNKSYERPYNKSI